MPMIASSISSVLVENEIGDFPEWLAALVVDGRADEIGAEDLSVILRLQEGDRGCRAGLR